MMTYSQINQAFPMFLRRLENHNNVVKMATHPLSSVK